MLGLQHEQQHQELLLSDLLYHFAQNPLYPAYLESSMPVVGEADAQSWHVYQGGLFELGHEQSSERFAFDNESPRHPVFLAPHRLARRLVSTDEFRQFIDDGGYQQAKLWLADGWQWRQQQAIDAPLYWRRDATGGWQEFTLYGLHPLSADAAVAHISYYEADAFARWAGKRLPTEAEWEHAAAQSSLSEHAEVLRAQCKIDADFFGQLWQWTSSSYTPYPGFQPASGAVGEYNGKFMCNNGVARQRVRYALCPRTLELSQLLLSIRSLAIQRHSSSRQRLTAMLNGPASTPCLVQATA
ncbi:ergothioneine biosynthesis protein EgtB [Permianibacter aggregans]|uniref:Ergothioneine biosynthesis protein EgtB n=1 Tax=Permianibacter aggregans TaxID=1510150 RepID=A0A4R6UTM9_9GAMM|nr:ergothioneine biosynthesis protein EgtB [Permianibacter aggregans]